MMAGSQAIDDTVNEICIMCIWCGVLYAYSNSMVC